MKTSDTTLRRGAGAALAGGKGAAQPARSRKRRPSGPSMPGRREEVVRAAAALFLERGYGEVSIDDIVGRIGGSKGTIYAWFGGKGGLFEVVIRDFCARTTRSMEIEFDESLSIEKQLTGFSSAFLNLILSREGVSLYRLVVANTASFPELARIFYEAGPQAAYGTLAAWIRLQQSRGTIKAGDARQMATLHLDMLAGQHQFASVLGISEENTPAKVASTVQAAVAMFLACNAGPVSEI